MASGTADFTGKWKCYKNENFEDYMKATGQFISFRALSWELTNKGFLNTLTKLTLTLVYKDHKYF